MQLNIKSVAVIAVLAIGGIAGVYTMTAKESGPNPSDTTAGKLQPGVVLPPGHPAVSKGDGSESTGNSLANQEEVRSGKVSEKPDSKFSHFRVGNRNVKSIFADGSVVWVGTSGGVIRYDTATDDFRLFDVKSGLLSNGVFSVSKLDGRIALGTYGGGLSLYDQANDKWDNFNVPDGLGDAFVYKTLKAANGDIWIATWSGANRIRGGDLKDRSKWDIYTVENTKGGLPNDWVYSLEEGKNGEIWLATEGGLARFKDEKWQNWNHSKGVGASFEKVKNDPKFGTDPAKLSEHHARQAKEMGLEGVSGGGAYNPNYIVSLQVDRDGVVWCGTWGGGLARFDGKKWRNFTVADGLPGNHVFALHLDPAGKLWAGTNNGLARYDGGKFTVLTTEDGLFSNTIFSMTTAPDGSQWIGSFGGVTHLIAQK
ncbi:MAG: regulator [Nitrosomonadales bacterium]|nr:regulator [Nitrosomonadales bacterium]